jgi:hypothetical protein
MSERREPQRRRGTKNSGKKQTDGQTDRQTKQPKQATTHLPGWNSVGIVSKMVKRLLLVLHQKEIFCLSHVEE